MRTPAKQQGFTLFELLIAVSVFAIASYMAYSGLMQVMNARHHTGEAESRLTEIQLTFLYLERDLQHVVRRPIRNSFGSVEGEIMGDELADYRLALTRTGWRVPEYVQRSNLQRVGYLVQDEKLYRISWAVLDQAQDSQPKRTQILDQVENVEIRFLGADNQWVTSWNSLENTVQQSQQQVQPKGIPRAVAIKITLKDQGAINRMFLLTES
jgi:general secretion pathway protein J